MRIPHSVPFFLSRVEQPANLNDALKRALHKSVVDVVSDIKAHAKKTRFEAWTLI